MFDFRIGAQGGKGGEEAVFLLALVIDIERLGVLSAEGLGERVGPEAIVILADIAEEGHLPVAFRPFRAGLTAHFPGDIGLIVDEGRLVVTGGSQAPEHVFAGLVAQSVHLAVGTVAVPDIELCA